MQKSMSLKHELSSKQVTAMAERLEADKLVAPVPSLWNNEFGEVIHLVFKAHRLVYH